MFCGRCGAAIPGGNEFCSHCGKGASEPTYSLTGQPVVTSATSSAAEAPTSGKALASMVTGIFGLLFFFPAIAAIILGHISRSEIQKSNGRLKGKGMATAGLIMGYGMIAMIPFILIIAAIAIPNLLRARIAANESSALASIRTIYTAEITYRSAYPAVGFACSLESLGGSGTAGPSAEGAQLIDHALAAGRKYGYRFALENCVNSENEHKYQVVAHPEVRNQTGIRIFCSDESGVIKAGPGESAEDCMANGTAVD